MAANTGPLTSLGEHSEVPVVPLSSCAADVPAAGSSANVTDTVVAKKPPQKGPDWFSKLFGFREPEYEEVPEWLRVRDAPGGSLVLESLVNRLCYSVGCFECPSLAELQGRAGAGLPGRLTVTNELGDVATKMALPENRFATFQVASQFNCLEFVSPKVVPESGITGYIRDRTQGPACSIACGPATAFRNYFVPLDSSGRVADENVAQRGQTADLQLNCLVDFEDIVGNRPPGRFFEIRNGYSMAGDRNLSMLDDVLQGLEEQGKLDEARTTIRVGVHRDIQVTSSNWGAKLLDDPEHTVTQVFCSACAVAYNRTEPSKWRCFASLVLESAYEATLWAAVLAAMRHGSSDGSRRVFLTCLGGGVFGNEMAWISDAMRRAFDKFRDQDLDIRIITYSGSIDPMLKQLEEDFGSMET